MPVYICARDLSGLAIGTHQFIVIANKGALAPRKIGFETIHAKALGKGHYGIVIGAQNRGKLKVEFFENGDFTAAREHFGGIKTHWYKPDYDAEVHQVKFAGVSDKMAMDKVIMRIESYLLNQSQDPIRYPTAGLGVNSNSWAQSVIEYAGGKGLQDFDGFDVSNTKRIPRTYFEPVCLPTARPKVN